MWNDETAVTVAVVRSRNWQCVRLGRRLKKVVDPHWVTTLDADEVARWFQAGYNVGLVCHERTGVAVLDPDRMLDWADMVDALGQPSRPWVLTGGGHLHYYLAWEPLPAKLVWKDGIIGEIQRGPGAQQVVLPGSIHEKTGKLYRWNIARPEVWNDPIAPLRDPLPTLPADWRAYFGGQLHAVAR